MKKVYELRYEAGDVYYQLHLAEKKETLENFIESVRTHDVKIIDRELETVEDERFFESWEDEHPLKPWHDQILGYGCPFASEIEHLNKSQSYAEYLTIHEIELLG